MENNNQLTEEQTAEHSQSHVDEFISLCNPFGYRDIQCAINTYLAVGKTAQDLFDDCTSFVDDIGGQFNELDICYIAHDNNLQSARHEIESQTSFDICNDSNFEVYGNFICTSINYDDDDKDSLISALKELDRDTIKELLALDVDVWFFEEIELSIEEVLEK